MKTLIVGAGTIGTIYGWALSEAGVDVTHLVRPGRKEAYGDGIALDLLDERKDHPKHSLTRYALKCVEEVSPGDGYELIFLPTGVRQTEEALRALVPVTARAAYLIFCGAWEGSQFIDRLIPRYRYVLGYADGGGAVREGVCRANLGCEAHLGELTGRASETLGQVEALFARADIQSDLQQNILHWQWQHLAKAVGFGAGLAGRRDVGAYLDDREALRLGIHATRELYELCRRRGVELWKYPEARHRHWPVWLAIPYLRWSYSRSERLQRYAAGMASDSGLRETKACHESMMKTARQLRLAMPHTEALGEYLRGVT